MHMALYLQDGIIDALRGPHGEPPPIEVKRQIKSYLSGPTRLKWSSISGLHVRGYTTLWQMVRMVDPTFPQTGPVFDIEGRMVKGWERIPAPPLLLDALHEAGKYTTSNTVERRTA
jgi:hypothetical protein